MRHRGAAPAARPRVGAAAVEATAAYGLDHHICYVAGGQLDAHAESVAPWDIAAAGLIAREAGAVTGHVAAVPPDTSPELYGIEVVVAAPGIRTELMDLLRSALVSA